MSAALYDGAMIGAPMSDDATVEHWLAWLDHGVTLRIPETSIPYCDVHMSTLRSVGDGMYERSDDWSAFEAGHGRYGSTEHKTFDVAALRVELREFAKRGADRVRPLDENATPVIDAAEALALVRSGQRAISPWFSSADRALLTEVVGADAEAYRVTTRSEKIVAIERLAPEDDALLKGLCIAKSALVEQRITLLDRARRHCDRRQASLRELASNPQLALASRDGAASVKAGRSAEGLAFYDFNHSLVVHELDAHELRQGVARALLVDEDARCSLIDDAKYAAICAIEDKLTALRLALLQGEVAVQSSASVGTWWLWVDGVARAVTFDGAAPLAMVDEEPRLPTQESSMYVCLGMHPDRFRPVDDAVRAAVRAMVVARPR